MSAINTEPRHLHCRGEFVRILSRAELEASRDEDGIIETPDGNVVLEPMLAFAGMSARILGVDEFGDFKLDVDKGEYGWSDAMFVAPPEA